MLATALSLRWSDTLEWLVTPHVPQASTDRGKAHLSPSGVERPTQVAGEPSPSLI